MKLHYYKIHFVSEKILHIMACAGMYLMFFTLITAFSAPIKIHFNSQGEASFKDISPYLLKAGLGEIFFFSAIVFYFFRNYSAILLLTLQCLIGIIGLSFYLGAS